MAGRPHDADEPDDAAGADGATGDATDVPRPDATDAGDAATDAPASRPRDLPDDAEVDERWRAIVAELGDLGAERPPTPRRRATDLPPAARPGPGSRTVRPAGSAEPAEPAAPPAGPPGPRAWAPDPELEEAEDHFTPPDPGPVLTGDPLLTMAWGAAVGVPLLLLLAVVVWRDIPSVVLTAAGAAFVAAVALLLWRMPHRRDDDEGPGAVV